MNIIREFIAYQLKKSNIGVDIYGDQLSSAICELLLYLHNGYDENCEKLIDNCLYYEKLYLEAKNNQKQYSKIAKRLGIK